MKTMNTILYYENLIKNAEKEGLEAMLDDLWPDFANMCIEGGKGR